IIDADEFIDHARAQLEAQHKRRQSSAFASEQHKPGSVSTGDFSEEIDIQPFEFSPAFLVRLPKQPKNLRQPFLVRLLNYFNARRARFFSSTQLLLEIVTPGTSQQFDILIDSTSWNIQIRSRKTRHNKS